ncbi:hypothetical protein [Benzoatithermus flavus]|uniref:Uncharacterized protein n=1 Tax=Benzoatithermus flavus TaxID=3108223 RepID=A0ABU8XSK6_9PROT
MSTINLEAALIAMGVVLATATFLSVPPAHATIVAQIGKAVRTADGIIVLARQGADDAKHDDRGGKGRKGGKGRGGKDDGRHHR